MLQAWRWATFFALLLAASPARADPRLPAIFSDHMVLQQQMPIGVWGWAGPDERIEVRLRTQVVDVRGAPQQLDGLVLADTVTGATETVPAAALFVLIGAEPRTQWLAGTLERDRGGYLLTGRDLLEAAGPTGVSRNRPPLPLETSLPGVFAAGDVRHGAVKRVASAVGEGSIAVQLIHQFVAAERLGQNAPRSLRSGQAAAAVE